MPYVVIFEEEVNFRGRSRALGVGRYRLVDSSAMNDLTSSIRVPSGLAAIVHEDADASGGYGRCVDLLEDHADPSALGFDNKISFIQVFGVRSTTAVVMRDHRQGHQGRTQTTNMVWVLQQHRRYHQTRNLKAFCE